MTEVQEGIAQKSAVETIRSGIARSLKPKVEDARKQKLTSLPLSLDVRGRVESITEEDAVSLRETFQQMIDTATDIAITLSLTVEVTDAAGNTRPGVISVDNSVAVQQAITAKETRRHGALTTARMTAMPGEDDVLEMLGGPVDAKKLVEEKNRAVTSDIAPASAGETAANDRQLYRAGGTSAKHPTVATNLAAGGILARRQALKDAAKKEEKRLKDLKDKEHGY